MQVVGIRELKNRLSEYLRLVRAGEVVLITERGKVVGQIAPPPMYLPTSSETEEQALARLERIGVVRLAHGRPASIDAEPLPPPAEEVDLSAALEAVRQDRG